MTNITMMHTQLNLLVLIDIGLKVDSEWAELIQT